MNISLFFIRTQRILETALLLRKVNVKHFRHKLTNLRHTDDQAGFTKAREVGLDESG